MKIIPFLIIVVLTTTTTVIDGLKSNTEEFMEKNPDIIDDKHGVRMGKILPECDDGKNNLEIDWNGSPINHTCYHRKPFDIDLDIDSIVHCENIRSDYM
ncbi:hypothetical protein BLA29_014328, partial [Euroglyphus maynei]